MGAAHVPRAEGRRRAPSQCPPPFCMMRCGAQAVTSWWNLLIAGLLMALFPATLLVPDDFNNWWLILINVLAALEAVLFLLTINDVVLRLVLTQFEFWWKACNFVLAATCFWAFRWDNVQDVRPTPPPFSALEGGGWCSVVWLLMRGFGLPSQ